MAGGFSRQFSRFERATAAALYSLGNDILSRSDELIPVDTGTAKSSGRVIVEAGVAGPRVTVGYGYGDSTNPKTGEPAIGYVIPLHERVEISHPTGQAKFLEQAANEHLPKAGRRIAARIQRATVAGGQLQFFLEDLDGEE